jgi:NHL repeat-containing protein
MRKFLTFILTVAIPLQCGCLKTEQAVVKQSATEPSELTVKQHLQQDLKDNSVQGVEAITPHRLVSNGAGSGFVFPASISYSDSGTIYISDNNGHRIHHWVVDSPTTSALMPESGNGKLKFPNSIQFVDGKIFISDNDGIKVFSPAGHLQQLIRPYFGIFSFIKTTKATIFANTLIRNAEAQDPLIVELDQRGKVLRGFGRRHNVAGHNGLEDQAFLTVSGDLLLAAFKYQPLVEIYDVDSGKLVGSFAIDHPVFRSLSRELERQRVPERPGEGRVFVPRYLAGIRASGNRIFLCLSLPEPEIWELDQNGNRLRGFHVSGLPPAVDIFGFDVRLMKEKLTFTIGIIDQGWHATVAELEGNPN